MLKYVLIIAAIAALLTESSFAFNNHSLIAYYALKNDLSGKTVKVEKLIDFLRKERPKIAQAMEMAENWCMQNLTGYKPLPRKLVLKEGGHESILENNFYKAIRVNPLYFNQNFIQDVAGDLSSKFKNRITDWQQLYISNLNYQNDIPFLLVKSDDELPAINIVSTAADLPDYGIDCGLFEDNQSRYSGEYGFGTQPFGDTLQPRYQSASFRTMFYHNKLLTDAVPGLQSPYSLFRVKYYTEIAKVAFSTGHDYWGYYFAGLAMHYVINGCQPYYIAVSPGKKDEDILAKYKELKKGKEYINKVLLSSANKQMFFESYLYDEIINERNKKSPEFMISSMQNKSKDSTLLAGFDDKFIVNALSNLTFKEGDRLDAALEAVTDTAKMNPVILQRNDAGDYRIDDFVATGKEKEMVQLKTITGQLMELAGSASRVYMLNLKK